MSQLDAKTLGNWREGAKSIFYDSNIENEEANLGILE